MSSRLLPPNSEPYRVKAGDTWWTLSNLPGPVANDMLASDLCYFNFRTRKAAEINWYLKTKVGCTRTTKDGKNYVFNQSDAPGVIYLPKLGTPLPVTEKEKPKTDYRMWFGIAAKIGETVVIVGNETALGYVVSADDTSRTMAVTARTSRAGVGFGASGCLALMLVTGVKRPYELNGHMQGEIDFELAIGVKAKGAIKAVLDAKKYAPLMAWVMRVGAKTPKRFALALAKNPSLVGDATTIVKNLGEFAGTGKDEPKVTMIDVPVIGIGAEASVYTSVTEFSAHDTCLD